jgi:large subunit ribosomal protein L6
MEERFVEIPEGVSVTVEGDNVTGYTIKASGPKGENSRFLKFRGVYIDKEDSRIRIWTENPKGKVKAMVGTFTTHIENLITGVKDGFEYKLKVVYAHFPIKVRVEGKEVVIENFLGEKYPRRAKIVGRAEVDIRGQEIFVRGIDIEECGQTAANLEQTTKIRNKDPRVFQDGIYIVKKP